MIDTAIHELADYGVRTGLIPESERLYATNLILDLMHQDSIEDAELPETPRELHEILEDLLDEAVKRGLVEDSVTFRDLFDSRLMNTLTPRPAQVQEKFAALYAEDPKKATDWFYNLSKNSNYIRQDRIVKDKHWTSETPYGEIELSINLSKPEKDPKAIAAARLKASSSYPKCQLCFENEGYAGRADHPGRSNHRIIPITVNNTPWGFQYSPYVYFNEHCIVLNSKHEPMIMNRAAFQKLFDFVEQFPHYFLGSNADLPIVGGSILTHDHFQGGHHDFPMARAELEFEFPIEGHENVKAGVVNWPMSVIRLQGADKEELIDLADHILTTWRNYTDEDALILAETDGVPHNTITPIVRRVGDEYQIDLVLRNNLTTDEFPMGVYHPHPQWHHIKKENIGLIEVMGLAILPARLKKELEDLKKVILEKGDVRAIPELEKHADWADELVEKYPDLNEENIDDIINQEVGTIFSHVLEDAGVYKTTPEGREAFRRFIAAL